MKRSTMVEVISALFILLFVYTASTKLIEVEKFQYTLSKSPLIHDYASAVSWLLPISEILVALLLLLPKTKLWGLYSSAALMVSFTLYLAYMLAFTPKLPCSCGGVLQQMTWSQHLVFNVFFTGLAFAGVWLCRHPAKPKLKDELPPIVFT